MLVNSVGSDDIINFSIKIFFSIIFFFLLVLFDRIIIYGIKHRKSVSSEMKNGISVLIDLLFIIVLVYGILYIFEAEYTLILGGSAFF